MRGVAFAVVCALLGAGPVLAQDAEFEKAVADTLAGEAKGEAPIACTDETEELYPRECGVTATGATRDWFIPKRRQVAAAAAPARKRAAGAPVRSVCALRDADQGAANLCATFGLGSAELTSHAKRTLDSVARIMTSDPRLRSRRFDIEGHADASGDPARNRTLSGERAQAVAQYLATRGVPADRLRAEGLGSSRPLKGRAATDPINRRVQVRTVS